MVCIVQNEIKTCGMKIEMTRSQKQNFLLISDLWKTFNYKLYQSNLKQTYNWKKYGLTLKENGTYYYISAIPFCENNPFETYTIRSGSYQVFQHKGDMKLLPEQIKNIYTNNLSEEKLDLDRSLIHYEYYDRRFNWSASDSIIDIYVPIKDQKSEELC